MLQQEKDRKAVFGPDVTNHFDSGMKNNTASFNMKSNLVSTELKYITKKECAERYLKKSQLYDAQPHLEFTQYSLYHPQGSPNQQTIPVPEELNQESTQEQRFVNEFDTRCSVEGPPVRMPRKPQQQSSKFFNASNQFSTSKENEELIKQFGVSKTQFLTQTTNLINDPEFEEKNFVRRHLDDYDQYRPVEEAPRVNVFKEGLDRKDLPKDVNDSLLERLYEKFDDIYANTQAKYQSPMQYGVQNNTTSGARVYWEIPYVSDQTLQDSHVIATLLSPHTKTLYEVQKQGNSPQRTKTSELGSEVSSPDAIAKKKSPRVTTKQSQERKTALHCKLFEHFDKEYYLKRESSNNGAQGYSYKQSDSPRKGTSPTRTFNSEKFVRYSSFIKCIMLNFVIFMKAEAMQRNF